MILPIDILDQPFDCDIAYRVIRQGSRAEGTPVEYEITEVTVLDHDHKPLPTPEWLTELIIEELENHHELAKEIQEIEG